MKKIKLIILSILLFILLISGVLCFTSYTNYKKSIILKNKIYNKYKLNKSKAKKISLFIKNNYYSPTKEFYLILNKIKNYPIEKHSYYYTKNKRNKTEENIHFYKKYIFVYINGKRYKKGINFKEKVFKPGINYLNIKISFYGFKYFNKINHIINIINKYPVEIQTFYFKKDKTFNGYIIFKLIGKYTF
jgi:hypothetical protein